MLNDETAKFRVLEFLRDNYANGVAFTTGDAREHFRALGVPDGTFDGALNKLVNEGVLDNERLAGGDTQPATKVYRLRDK